MYTQNSNRDLFLSQQWSQIDSQDWNTQISSQDLNSHRVPSTPSGRVLPPTPSTSGNQNGNLSNSWSGRVGSQVVPQSISYPSTPRGLARESNFSKEMRFALHAVLSVMKDLPAKLREIILSTSESQNNSEVICENLKKIIEEKTIGFEKVFSLLEENESFFSEAKKSQELIHSNMEEFQKTLLNHSEEVSSLNGDIKSRTLNLKKQFSLLRKLYIMESKKIQTLVSSLRSNEIEGKLDDLGLRMSSKIEEIKTTSNDILNHLKEKEETEASALSNVIKEMTWLKSYIRDLPSIIEMNIRKRDSQLGGRGNVRVAESPWKNTCVIGNRDIGLGGRANVRVAESPWKNTCLIGNRKYVNHYSPVACVKPLVKGTTAKLAKEVGRTESPEKEHSETFKSLLDVNNCTADTGSMQNLGLKKNYYKTIPSTNLLSSFSDCNSLPHGQISQETCNSQQEKLLRKFPLSSSRIRMVSQRENVVFNRPANRFRPY